MDYWENWCASPGCRLSLTEIHNTLRAGTKLYLRDRIMDDLIKNQIETAINDNHVVLFMKGSKEMPLCGFSAAVVQILNQMGVSYKDINVLENQEIREGIKEFSNWPTIPQLYVDKEFIGGCDIVREMYSCGELALILSSYSKVKPH
jgi:monothiol glutaredoxin